MRWLLVMLLSMSALLAADKKQKEDKDWIKDQDDQTDTYAIPLDTSEEEEEAEIEALKRNQAPKCTPKP